MINNVEDYKKYVIKPNFVSQKIFSENFVAIHENKPVLILNKPTSVGFSILSLSKLLIYKFHYNYIKIKYNANLLFTDTYILVYKIKANDVYEEFYADNNDFVGFSDSPQNSKCFDLVNKKVIGKMKYEFKGVIISEFVRLKSKMYSLTDVYNEENKKAKRVNKNVVKNIRQRICFCFV